MRPLYYFDITIRASNMKEGVKRSIPVIARLMKVLHGYFGQHPGKFAVAFPEWRKGVYRHIGNTVRIFTEVKDDFDDLVKWIENNDRVSPYVSKSFPHRVDEEKILGWVEYRRYRIPSRSSRLKVCRDYRMKASEEYPFFCIASSNGFSFSMHISAQEGQKTDRCIPTTYGLSGTIPFSLPIIK